MGFNGFGGGANIQQLMKQAQKMQAQMQAEKEELENSTFYANAGGGMVEVKMNGKREVLAIKIKPEAVDPDDVEMLEDLITAAINDANRQVLDKIEQMSSGLNGFGM